MSTAELTTREEQVDNRLEMLYLATVPWTMAASSVAGLQFGDLRHTGLLWIMTLLCGLALLPLKRGRRITFPWYAWLPLYVFLGISLTWSEFDWRNNIQIFVQMAVYPILGVVASYAIRTEEELETYNTSYVLSTLFIGAACVFFMAGPGRAYQETQGSLYVGFAERPGATSLIVVGALFLAQIHKSPFLAVFMWFVSFAICIVSQSRMATLVVLLLWMVHPRFASLRMRFLVSVIVMVLGMAAFNTPIIQERFFTKKTGFSGKGTISDVLAGKFDSAGRFEAWPIILKKSADSPLVGHGVGQSAPFVYSVWAPMDKPHNEYLKLLYEGGYIGLGLFIFALLATTFNILWNLSKCGYKNWAASAALMGWIGFILMAIVDNPLVYGNNFLHPLFVLVGAANGITRAHLAKLESSGHVAPSGDLNSSGEGHDESSRPHSTANDSPMQPILLR